MLKINSRLLLVILFFLSFTSKVLAEAPSPSPSPDVDTTGEPIKIIESDVSVSATGTAEAPLQEVPVEPSVFVHKVKGKMNAVYKNLFTKLENNGYYVIFEPNIGRNLAHFAKRWGKDYNKNKLDSIRSMVFCNGWYANKISNEDPDMLALCPLHVTLTHKNDITSILFVKPGVVSQGSAANSVALELEQDVIRIIKESAK